MDRVRRERDLFVGGMLREVQGFPEADRIRGYARFMDNHTLAIDGHTQVTAKSIVIATGSTASLLDSATALGDRLIISDDVFNWHDLPKSVAVIGTGIVGLELGQALHRLGVQVVVLGRGGRVGPLSDPEILRRILYPCNVMATASLYDVPDQVVCQPPIISIMSWRPPDASPI
jgi:dihydrolipoamide dehydrogenase